MGLFGGSDKRKEMEKCVSGCKVSFSGFFSQEGLPTYTAGLFAVALEGEELRIMDGTHTYTIPKERLMDVSYTASLEEYRRQKSSLAKGVLGAALFGAAGAVIGAAPIEKIVSTTTHAAVVIRFLSEQKEENEITLFLDTTGSIKTLTQMQAFARCAKEEIVPLSGGNGTVRL